jgi:hypothetical protein
MSANYKSERQFQLLPTHFRIRRGLAFGIIIVAALFAFEAFNYSTTEFALSDLLGDLSFAGIKWATILAIAFCGIDFAGIARLFTPEEGEDEPTEVWYLFGAWLLAATMNAMLTWWGISKALLNSHAVINGVISQETLLRVTPIFVAILVWLIRVLIIGTFSVAGDRLFSQSDRKITGTTRTRYPEIPASGSQRSQNVIPVPTPRPAISTNTFRPTPKTSNPSDPVFSRTEPTYHPTSASASPSSYNNAQPRNLQTKAFNPNTMKK